MRGDSAACRCYSEEAKTPGAGWHSVALNNPELQKKKKKQVKKNKREKHQLTSAKKQLKVTEILAVLQPKPVLFVLCVCAPYALCG